MFVFKFIPKRDDTSINFNCIGHKFPEIWIIHTGDCGDNNVKKRIYCVKADTITLLYYYNVNIQRLYEERTLDYNI